ncbi:unnamed protein product, partial [Cladocopium goreaui]
MALRRAASKAQWSWKMFDVKGAKVFATEERMETPELGKIEIPKAMTLCGVAVPLHCRCRHSATSRGLASEPCWIEPGPACIQLLRGLLQHPRYIVQSRCSQIGASKLLGGCERISTEQTSLTAHQQPSRSSCLGAGRWQNLWHIRNKAPVKPLSIPTAGN